MTDNYALGDIESRVLGALQELAETVRELRRLAEAGKLDSPEADALGSRWERQRRDFENEVIKSLPRDVRERLLDGEDSVTRGWVLRFRPRDPNVVGQLEPYIRDDIEAGGGWLRPTNWNWHSPPPVKDLLQNPDWTPDWHGVDVAIIRAKEVFGEYAAKGRTDLAPTQSSVLDALQELAESVGGLRTIAKAGKLDSPEADILGTRWEGQRWAFEKEVINGLPRHLREKLLDGENPVARGCVLRFQSRDPTVVEQFKPYVRPDIEASGGWLWLTTWKRHGPPPIKVLLQNPDWTPDWQGVDVAIARAKQVFGEYDEKGCSRKSTSSRAPFRDIKSTVLAHLVKMEIPSRERAELEQDDAIRTHLIEQFDDPDSLMSTGPRRGDTLGRITEAVQEKWPGIPEFTIKEALEVLVEDGEVFLDGDASSKFRDAVWRAGHELNDVGKRDVRAELEPEKRSAKPQMERPQESGLVIDENRRQVCWNGIPLQINTGAQFQILATLLAAEDGFASYKSLMLIIQPRTIGDSVEVHKAPKEVKESVSSIRRAIKRSQCRATIKSIQGKGYAIIHAP